jgi:transposase InsO family protein
VRTAGSTALDLLLSANAGKRGELAAIARARRTYLRLAFFGSRKMAVDLATRSTRSCLRGVTIERPNQVWSTDITYIPMRGGFLYLVAVMDWSSRLVLGWELSNTMETGFCLAALDAAFRFRPARNLELRPRLAVYLRRVSAPLKRRGSGSAGMVAGARSTTFLWKGCGAAEVRIDLSGRLRHGPRNVLENNFRFYNHRRPHQALGYQAPANLFPPKSKRSGRSLDGVRRPPSPLGFIAFVFRNGRFPYT